MPMTESQANKAYTELKSLIIAQHEELKRDLSEIKEDVSQLKEDVSQLKEDVSVIADVLTLERDAKGNLRKTA